MAETVSEGGSNREELVKRLFGAFAVQVREMEARVAAHEGEEILEDAKILAGLAKTMEVLVSLDRKVSQGEAGSVDLEAVRTELSERLARLIGGKSAGKGAADCAKTKRTPRGGAATRS